MLRKIVEFYESVFGEDDWAGSVPIPRDNPVMCVSRGRARAYRESVQQCIERLWTKYGSSD